MRRDLAGIRVPVHVLHGERDRLIPLAAARYLATRLRGGRLTTIVGAGHAPFLSYSERLRQTMAVIGDG